MTTTTNLGITEVATNQTQPEVTINTALDALDNAGNRTLAFTFTTNARTLTGTEFTRNYRFTAGNQSADATLTVPLTSRKLQVIGGVSADSLNIGTSGTITGLDGSSNNLFLNSGTLAIKTGPTFIAARGTAGATVVANPLIVTGNTVASPATSGPTFIDIVGPDGLNFITQWDAFGAIPFLRTTRADGTAALPTAVQNGDTIAVWEMKGYTGAAYGSSTNMAVSAIENYTTAANGSQITFQVVTKGALTTTTPLTLTGDSTVKAVQVAGGATVAGGFNVTTGQTKILATRGTSTALIISTDPTVASPAITGAHILDFVGPDGAAFVVGFDAFGTGADPSFRMTSARGTRASPTAVQANDFLGELDVRGHDGTAYGGAGGFNVQTIENWTTAAHGSKLNFTVIIQGTTSGANALIVSGTTTAARVKAAGGFETDTIKVTSTIDTSFPLGHGLALNAGSIIAHGTLAYTGTAAGTVTIAPTEAIKDVILSMPAAGGTVTVAVTPAYAYQEWRLHIKQGTTAGVVNLNSGFVFAPSGGPTVYTATGTANVRDMLWCQAVDGTHAVVGSLLQGITI